MDCYRKKKALERINLENKQCLIKKVADKIQQVNNHISLFRGIFIFQRAIFLSAITSDSPNTSSSWRGQAFLPPFYRWGSWNSESWEEFPRAILLMGSRRSRTLVCPPLVHAGHCQAGRSKQGQPVGSPHCPGKDSNQSCQENASYALPCSTDKHFRVAGRQKWK